MFRGQMDLLKEFIVCFTLDSDVKWGKIRKNSNMKKDDILQEVLQKVKHSKYLIIKSENREHIINTSKIRYIRILDDNQEPHLKENEMLKSLNRFFYFSRTIKGMVHTKIPLIHENMGR